MTLYQLTLNLQILVIFLPRHRPLKEVQSCIVHREMSFVRIAFPIFPFDLGVPFASRLGPAIHLIVWLKTIANMTYQNCISITVSFEIKMAVNNRRYLWGKSVIVNIFWDTQYQ